jgi:hypothetical protein
MYGRVANKIGWKDHYHAQWDPHVRPILLLVTNATQWQVFLRLAIVSYQLHPILC